MKSLMTTRLATLAFAAATTAQASVIEIDLGLDGPISNDFVSFDLFGAPTLVDGTFVLSAPDGIADMTFSDSSFDGKSAGSVQVPLVLFPDVGTELTEVASRFTNVGFATTANGRSQDMVAFNPGDDISSFDGEWAPFGEFYFGDEGVLSTIGDSGLFGFRVEYLEATPLLLDYDSNECIDVAEPPSFCFGEPGGVGKPQVLATFYGFMDITRGSIGINTLAINTTSGASTFAGVTTTPVPLPAAGWMLLAGLGGIAAMRRRKG